MALAASERADYIQTMLTVLVYKARNGMAPNYIQDLCVPVSTVSTRSALRSAARGDLVVPRIGPSYQTTSREPSIQRRRS